MTVRGEPAELTYVEFEILAALARSPGHVFDRPALLERIWGDSSYRDPRTIDVHIRHLREKIESEPKLPEYLLTVRGAGYRFRDEEPVSSGAGPDADRRPRSSVRTRLVLLFFAITAIASASSTCTSSRSSARDSRPSGSSGSRRRAARSSTGCGSAAERGLEQRELVGVGPKERGQRRFADHPARPP